MKVKKHYFKTKAQQSGPEYGQVKAIYELITGEIIPLQEPRTGGRESRKKDNQNDTENLLEIKIFPNPIVDGYLQMNTSKSVEGILEVLSINGEMLLSKEILEENNRINVSTFPSGMYFCRLQNENGILHTEKVVIINN